MKSKVELLAPAGNYEAFMGAVNAGADAVYLGGDKYGARAYADNFSTEEICQAIHTAHFMGKKIYLAVNTLIKETELEGLYGWLLPFYEAGLDGVIVQDLGVLCYVRDHFKGLALHASTQMTLTGPGGVSILQEQGVERIVPARELSLEEVRTIKDQTGIEIECFIHGAMCYCYSGKCLLSSILGGRSGNRGRCAQPCRLPYEIYENNTGINGVEYPLSLKDMCTITYIPQLIEAGIDSFKIEGRMKKPEYAAGVTALYRKYIDLYEKKGADGYHVEREDLEKLHSLYIRSEVQTGYYERHNGKEMITLHQPSYAGSDPELLERIRTVYLHEPDKQPVKMRTVLKIGEAACLQITGNQGTDVTVYGNVVEKAQNMPLQEENIRKQLIKTGNSLVSVSECEIVMQGDVFMPVSALNELRRKGVEAFERQYIEDQGMISKRETPVKFSDDKSIRLTESVKCIQTYSQVNSHHTGKTTGKAAVDILVSTYEQLTAATEYPCRRIYIESDLYMAQYERISEYIRVHGNPEYYLALPYILRARDKDYMHRLAKLVGGSAVHGFLIRNLEEAAYVRSLGETYAMVPDAGLYVFNSESMRFLAHYGAEYTLPYELNGKEAGRLTRYARQIGMKSVMIVYSRIPMMITANCVSKTAGRCSSGGEMRIRDRYGTSFMVETNCTHCYNIIYNSVPYSLHLQQKEAEKVGADIWRYDFTVESGKGCRRILDGKDFPYEKYTTGHLKRGVE
ncbi:MAG: U32 family peptidase [Lachnospiraceae bacterium]|nr:U32 family peptidase [Lachnospiraceae bacterium]